MGLHFGRGPLIGLTAITHPSSRSYGRPLTRNQVGEIVVDNLTVVKDDGVRKVLLREDLSPARVVSPSQLACPASHKDD